MARVLVVDDDGHIREVVRFALQSAGFEVIEASDGSQALERFETVAATGAIDCVVLDIVMPGEDGLGVCRALRAGSDVPILFLTSRDDEIDRVLGLELGGDDYVVKPFSPRELVARVKAVLRRVARASAPPETAGGALRHGALEVDPERHRCRWAGAAIELTATEFALVSALLGRPGRVYTRDELVDRAWGYDHHITDRTVDSHVRRIRKKLADAGGDPIETVYGVGYRLRDVPT